MAFGIGTIFNAAKGDAGPKGTPSQSGNRFSGELAQYSRDAMKRIVRPDETGFMPYQRTGLNVFAQLLRGKQSADWSARGFNLPTSEDAVVGSALTQAAPNLFNLQNENQLIPGRAMQLALEQSNTCSSSHDMKASR